MDKKINNLISRHLSANTSPEEDRWLEKWISESSANKAEFEKSRLIWETALNLKKDRDADVNAAWSEFKQIAENPQRKERSLFAPLRIAAGLALIVALAIITWTVLPENDEPKTIAGQQKINIPVPTSTTIVTDTLNIDAILDSLNQSSTNSQLAGNKKKRSKGKNVVMITIVTTDSAKAFYLPDNSIVFLNDHSTLRYEETFGRNNRKISLAGEAYFEPVKDTIQFMVSCGKTVTRGSGTFFNIKENKNAGEVELIVVSGIAEFSGVGKKEYKKLVLNAGERAVYGKNDIITTSKVMKKDFKWWQKKNLRARLKRIIEKIKNTFR